MKEVIEDLKRSIECTKSYGLTSIKIQQEEQLIDYVEELQQRIDKAIEYIKETELYQVVYDDEGNYFNTYDDKATADLLQILGDKENEET